MAPFVVRGASRGFSVLLIGGVLQPWVGHFLAPLGYVWLLLVAVGAFAWAAWPRSTSGVRPPQQRADRVAIGTSAALGSYVLVLPLVLSAADSVPWTQILITSLTAVLVGGLVGGLMPTHRES